MTYTLVVAVREADLSEPEIESGYGDVRRDLSMFRKGQTPEDLRDAMDFWTSRGYRCAIYKDLWDFDDS